MPRNAMHGTYRSIFSALVDDPDFQRLSPLARHVFLTLRVCPQLGPAGIFRCYPAVLAEQAGYDVEVIEKALMELEAGRWVVREGPILWLRNALRHDPSMRLSDVKHRKTVKKWLSGLPQLAIVRTFCEYYKITRPSDAPFKGQPKGLRRGSPQEQEDRRPNPKTDSESDADAEAKPAGQTAGGAPPAPPLVAVAGSNGNPDTDTDTKAALQLERIRERIRAQHPGLDEHQVNLAALEALAKLSEGSR